jgi:hypothetical protein
MTRTAQATAPHLTVTHYRVSGGELTCTQRPGFAPVWRLCGARISATNAARKLGR